MIALSTHSFVLFPSSTAITATELSAIVSDVNEKDTEDSLSHTLVIVIDGTWREARRMRHHPVIKDLPEIQLCGDSLEGYKSKFVARQKSKIEERISTLEAVALLLLELAPSEASTEATTAQLLFENLDIVMKQLLLQMGLKEKTNLKRIKAPQR